MELDHGTAASDDDDAAEHASNEMCGEERPTVTGAPRQPPKPAPEASGGPMIPPGQ